MPIPPPDPARVARFRGDLEALAGPAPGRLGIAVSGGPDSLALLLLAAAAFPGQARAATVEHRLRPESADEATTVGGWLAARRIASTVLVWDGDKPIYPIEPDQFNPITLVPETE